jgi:hypothetical protein
VNISNPNATNEVKVSISCQNIPQYITRVALAKHARCLSMRYAGDQSQHLMQPFKALWQLHVPPAGQSVLVSYDSRRKLQLFSL